MRPHPALGRFCWFLATVLATASYGLLLAWVDAGTGYEVSPARNVLLISSAIAIVAMIVLMVVAYRIDR